MTARLAPQSQRYHPLYRDYLPYREYASGDVQPVKENEKYAVDVEVWPTNTVLEPNELLF